MRSVAGALDWMRSQDAANATGWKGYCLRACRTAYALPGGTPDADAWWAACPPQYRHPWSDRPPAGAAVYWAIGAHGHIALSDGNGNVWGTDLPTVDQIGRVPIGEVRRRWGAREVGWANWLNGSVLPIDGTAPPTTTPPPTPTPEDDDMPLTDDDLARIAHRVWTHELTTGYQKSGDYDAKNPRTVTARDSLVEAAANAASGPARLLATVIQTGWQANGTYDASKPVRQAVEWFLSDIRGRVLQVKAKTGA